MEAVTSDQTARPLLDLENPKVWTLPLTRTVNLQDHAPTLTMGTQLGLNWYGGIITRRTGDLRHALRCARAGGGR